MTPHSGPRCAAELWQLLAPAARPSGARLRLLILVMVGGAALYGAVLGGWHGGRLLLYAAVKLPLVLLITCLLTLIFGAVGARALGVPLALLDVAVLTVTALAIASLLLAALAPVAAFFEWACPRPSPHARLAHNLLYLMHTAFVGVCGLVGCRALWRGLTGRFAAAAQPRGLRSVFALWILAYALVGGEVAWAFRPFVGSIFEPVAFLRADALRGNVYEFIFTDIVPYLRSGETPP